MKPLHLRVSCIASHRGVTLIELLVVIAIIGILTVVATPAFQETIARNRIAAQSNEFLSTLNFARTEAIKRGHSITLCQSSNATTCASIGGWEKGWLAFADTNANNTLDMGEASIRVWSALNAGFFLIGSSNVANSIRYDARGMAQNTGHLLLCKGTKINGARAIVVTTARPRVSYDSNQGAPKNDAGISYTTCTP